MQAEGFAPVRISFALRSHKKINKKKKNIKKSFFLKATVGCVAKIQLFSYKKKKKKIIIFYRHYF
jgi:hypothetical protein